MDAARGFQQYAIAGLADRHLNTVRLHGFFIIFVAISFIFQEFIPSTTGTCGLFTAFVMLILGIWMVMLSFFLHMFPLAAARLVPAAMEAAQMIVFGLRV